MRVVDLAVLLERWRDEWVKTVNENPVTTSGKYRFLAQRLVDEGLLAPEVVTE